MEGVPGIQPTTTITTHTTTPTTDPPLCRHNCKSTTQNTTTPTADPLPQPPKSPHTEHRSLPPNAASADEEDATTVSEEDEMETSQLLHNLSWKILFKMLSNIAQIRLVSSHPEVYDPCDDSFALVDALLADRANLLEHRPSICMEVGCGSGYVITSLALMLGKDSSGNWK
ncbi:unnamed protein product [Fraxinus pennsylvanica]|uniref:Uncharacterized protein n=1 Tax=Fraxinus pennsylvanica TaxID=56036 RepID=A0AAD1Z1W4_9LAMI|nr:unnamed protein product [Fraxinus pennsylvanica]